MGYTLWNTLDLAYANFALVAGDGAQQGVAHQMAAHEPARTTGLYDRRDDEVPLVRSSEPGFIGYLNAIFTALVGGYGVGLPVAQQSESLGAIGCLATGERKPSGRPSSLANR